jgi:uncharacterized protein YkwD
MRMGARGWLTRLAAAGAAVGALVGASAGIGAVEPNPLAPCAGRPATADQSAAPGLLRLVNAARARAGAPRMRMSSVLAGIAERRSLAMARGGRFGHADVGDHLAWAPEGVAAGETLALAPTVPDAFAGLMASPHHRRALLSPAWRVVGVGVARACDGNLVVTQDLMVRAPA